MKWIRFTLDTHTDAVDMLSYMLDEIGVEGIEIEDHLPLSEEDKKKMFVDILPDPEDNDGTAKVHFYMEPENCDPEKVMIQVQNIFQEIKPFCEIGKGTISLSETEDKDWINNWKTFFKPFRAADDIVIKPTWEEYKKEKDSDILIEIDPGIAFGTGSHETTKLCIQALDKYVKNGDSVLDVGCGSGILSIAALISNAFLKVKAGTGHDIVVANILADVIIPLTGVVKPHLKKGGLYITSGIIDTKEAEVREALLENGFEILDVTYMKEWCCFIATI